MDLPQCHVLNFKVDAEWIVQRHDHLYGVFRNINRLIAEVSIAIFQDLRYETVLPRHLPEFLHADCTRIHLWSGRVVWSRGFHGL